ncbi:hypothetical protein RhiirA5_472975 [Rhizophagus irregularis]|uniref:GmrSD restriction endonucleases N-terminal domain-containing protein n=1 Tax=Rhizophagus irregularis TaxID=588596 RepID=A0A2N0RIL4_9GLOM|nr:hypothetical protein RhiirA5_472975 [Rhizophagus irregularis]PKC63142.1 hypothetical protein RhiirA1_520023 [Rhizophagus irregularis]CAB4472781.1 unnamed protein product [Rhizophagus irregularis]CAB5179843.1 unnamed protein product [Rhizophagus irregularis]
MDEALTKPRNVSHTIYKLYGWLKKGLIDLDPEFQRDVVWTNTKQSHLIDSMLNNFYIPPVIFSCKKLDDKRWVRVCIDGKQRLTSIRKFINNEIPHINPSSGYANKRFYKSSNDKDSLTDSERELFECSEFICVEYYDLTLQQEQEIFSRVQLGIALTPAERLQAISSPIADFAHAIHNQYSTTLSLILDNKRSRPFQIISQSLHMIETEPERFNATPITITKYLKRDREVSEGFKALTKHVYTVIEEMINVDAELFRYGHKFSTVEFVFLAYMIAKLPKLPIYQYQNRLIAMRKHVWDKHSEVRFNTKVFSTLKEFVDNMTYEFTSNQQTSSHALSSHYDFNLNHQNISQPSSSRYDFNLNPQNISQPSSSRYDFNLNHQNISQPSSSRRLNSLQLNTNYNTYAHNLFDVKME